MCCRMHRLVVDLKHPYRQLQEGVSIRVYVIFSQWVHVFWGAKIPLKRDSINVSDTPFGGTDSNFNCPKSTQIHEHTVCPRSLEPLYIVGYYINRVKTFWTNSTILILREAGCSRISHLQNQSLALINAIRI